MKSLLPPKKPWTFTRCLNVFGTIGYLIVILVVGLLPLPHYPWHLIAIEQWLIESVSPMHFGIGAVAPTILLFGTQKWKHLPDFFAFLLLHAFEIVEAIFLAMAIASLIGNETKEWVEWLGWFWVFFCSRLIVHETIH
ncbi:hypothetical protein [Paraburkholderia sediminicola]|uniref:hypothetical protein n=1 Tax=Paraburkholderia sediminicola TaxID=458836 RepID=UPI0038BDE658